MEVEDVVADGDVVVFAGVEDWEFRSGFGNDGFGTAKVVRADGQDFCARVCDLRVVFLQLT